MQWKRYLQTIPRQTNKENVVSVVGHFIDENSDTSSSSSDSEDDIDFCKYHANIGYLSGDDNKWVFLYLLNPALGFDSTPIMCF